MFKVQVGSMPEWLMGADCKSAGAAYAGSNPARPKKNCDTSLFPAWDAIFSTERFGGINAIAFGTTVAYATS